MEEEPIIIAGKDIEVYLKTIGERGLYEDKVVLHVSNKHSGNAEKLLRTLRKSFGWEEQSREKVITSNRRCIYDISEVKVCAACGHRSHKKKCDNPHERIIGGCKEETRKTCKHYKQATTNKFYVIKIIIEKIPQLRDV